MAARPIIHNNKPKEVASRVVRCNLFYVQKDLYCSKDFRTSISSEGVNNLIK